MQPVRLALSAAEVAELVGLCRRTVLALAHEGAFGTLVTTPRGGRVLIGVAGLLAFLGAPEAVIAATLARLLGPAGCSDWPLPSPSCDPGHRAPPSMAPPSVGAARTPTPEDLGIPGLARRRPSPPASTNPRGGSATTPDGLGPATRVHLANIRRIERKTREAIDRG